MKNLYVMAALLSAASSCLFANEKPNFIIIYADDLGYNDLSCYGSKTIKTPHLDQMAKDGLKLMDFYATSASCTPSRAALMTGSYPPRVGMDHVLMPGNKDKNTGKILGLNPDEITLAEVVDTKGYATACIGKWHLGDAPKFMPNNHGFDEFFGIPYSNDMIPTRFPDLPLMRNGEVIESNPDQDYLTQRLTKESLVFIEKNKDQPFFLYLAHPMPHRPCHVSPEFAKRFSKEQLQKVKGGDDKKSRDFLYPGSVEEIDWSVGEILTKLKNLGLEENTLVVFTSDNGPKVGSAAPLRGKKGSNLEGGHRVPAIVQWKGRVPAGSSSTEVIAGMDFLPTFAALVGFDLPQDRVIDGGNILPLLEGKPDAKSSYDAFFYTHSGLAVREGKWKYHRDKKGGLFDLSKDIGEKKNLANKHPEIARRLDDLITEHLAHLKANSRPAGTLNN